MAGSTRNTLTSEHWSQGALAVLVDGSVEAVRVDVLARELGVTRGSFYWHFKDRDDLLQSVLQTWRTFATDQVIERFETSHTDPRSLLRELISLPFRGRSARRAARIELAIRAWARSDASVRRVVDEVDARRIACHAQCLAALGFSVHEARARAVVLYGFELAESVLVEQGSAAQKAERQALMEQLILSPLPMAR
jgi:AcrR family transcriptional regulator